jgi:Uma2 family endonuclease
MTVEEEVQLYLSNGTRLVWVINPRQRSATIYHSDRTARLLRADDVLDGEDVLPGFTCRLTDIL